MLKNFALSNLIIYYTWKNIKSSYKNNKLKGTLSDLIQFLATENRLEMMKNLFYFTLKVLFILKILKFLS